jgi:hypothetical protein
LSQNPHIAGRLLDKGLGTELEKACTEFKQLENTSWDALSQVSEVVSILILIISLKISMNYT